MKKAGEAPNISAIARQFKVKRAFVTKWVDCYQSTGGVSDCAVGRPSGLGTQKLGTVGCKRARELAQGKDGDDLDTKRVKKALQQEGYHHISRHTVSRALRSSMRGTVIPLKYKAPKVVIGINALQRQKRVAFARRNRDRTWKNVLWTDSKYFVVGGKAGGTLAKFRWVPQNEANTCETNKNAIQGHVYAGFGWHGKTDLVFVSGTTGKKRPAEYGPGKGVNAKEYMAVLQETLIPGAKKIFAAREPNSWVFMQDGAKPHTAKVTQKWLADNVPSYITAWPPNSPDLNPIENLWAVMAGSLAGTRFKNIDELKEGIEKAWDDIPISTMRKLVGGMHRRMRKVIQEDGRRISA